MESMEDLLTEIGPRNPLLFLSFSLINRIPGYIPDEKGILNQLDCMNDLLSSVSSSIFRLDSLKNVVAVACDSLMTISGAEAKKSIEIRIAALECLLILIDKLVSSGINSLIEIIPGILSRMIKLSTSRVDVEIDKIIILSLKVISKIVQIFWNEQDEWIVNLNSDQGDQFIEDNQDKVVLLKKKYRDNVDLIICALKPLIRCNQRISIFKPIILDIFNFHLSSKFNNNSSITCLKLFLLLNSEIESDIKPANLPIYDIKLKLSHNHQQILKIYNTEIVEWFQNADLDIKQHSNLIPIHEDIVKEKLELIFGLLNFENESIFMISDIFAIIKKLTALKVSIGDTVSIDYSCASDIGITEVFSKFSRNRDSSIISQDIAIPVIEFKYSLKFSAEFFKLTLKLFKRIVAIDHTVVLNELMNNFIDDSFELVMQKINLSSSYFSSLINKFKIDESVLELLEDCLKYHHRASADLEIEKSQMIHLATLKLIWSFENLKISSFNIISPHFLIIMSGMASKWILLREAATQIFKAIAIIYGKSDISQLVREHQRFFLDRLGIQLSIPNLFPEAPQIISCLVRDIVDPQTALKFTDLLVRKVNDNLALYQRHSAYCKDLLAVAQESILTISKSENVPFIDPKSFAFHKEEAEDSSDSIVEKLSCQQRIILDLLKVGINFILSDSKLIRSKSLDLIRNSVTCFTNNVNVIDEPSSLCQIIHIAWPNLMAVLKDSSVKEKDINQSLQSDLLVVESFFNCVLILFKRLPIFMRDRFVKDYWRDYLRINFKLFKYSHFSSSASKIVKILLEILQIGISNCKPSTEICLEIVEKLSILIISDDKNYHGILLKIFEAIAIIEPDVIWYFFNIQLGMITEISHKSLSNNSALKSFTNSELSAAANLKGNACVKSYYKLLNIKK